MRPHDSGIEVLYGLGIEGARRARGTVVVIDVLRSFTVSAYALAGGARDCLLVSTISEAQRLAAGIPGAVICAEEDGLPVLGIAISNSPTQIRDTNLLDRTVVQRSSSGTPVMAAVESSESMFAASLVVARATAQACLLRPPRTVTLVASADDPEDYACAQYLGALLRAEQPDLDRLLRPLRDSQRYARFVRGEWPGFPPSDLELSLAADRFEFAMPVTRQGSHLRLTAEPPVAAAT